MSKNPTFYDTMVSSPQWKAWYKEIMRRHLINEKDGEWKDNKTFDIDESQECGWLGDEHFQEFLKFCCSTQQAQMREEIEQEYAHPIENGYCCACEYDIAVMESKILESKQQYRDNLKKKIEKIDEGLCMDCCDSSRVKREVLSLLDQEREDK